MSRERLNGRVDRLEHARGLLPTADAAELAALEREYDRRFPGPLPDAFDTYTQAQLDDFLSYQASDTARRLDELRQRQKPARQRAEEAAARIAIASMDRDQLDEHMAALLAANSEEPPCQS